MKRIIVFTCVCLCLMSYLLTVRGQYGHIDPSQIFDKLDKATKPFELSPERGRFLLTLSLDQDRSFSLSPVLAEAAKPDVGYYKGKYYIYFAPGISLMAWPLYSLGNIFHIGQVTAFFLSAIFATGNFIMLFTIARQVFRLPFWASLAAGFIYSFSSDSWPYAVTLYQHQATTFFLLSGFYCAWVFKQHTRWSIPAGIWTWTAYALSITIDYPNALLLAPMMVYFLINAFSLRQTRVKIQINFHPVIFLCSFAFIVISVLHGYYNQLNFGSWKKLSGSIPSYKAAEQITASTSAAVAAQIGHAQAQKNPTGFFKEQNFIRGFHVLTISDERGIFYYFPVFILSLFGVKELMRRSKAETILLLFSVGVLLFLYSSWGDPWGGWAYGPRYLIPAMSILALFVANWIAQSVNSIIKKLVLLLLFIFSSSVSLLGALTTNSVPPASEAVLLKIGYNYLYNLRFLFDNHTGSFFYNTFLKSYITLTTYFLCIWLPIVGIFALILFVLPKSQSYDH